MMKRVFLLLMMVVVLASCATQTKIPYFQDVEPNVAFDYAPGCDITLRSGDELSIVVSSKNPELATMFNIEKPSGGSNETLLYKINSKGTIDFPILGAVEVVGLSREAIAEKIKGELISNKLINDPIVTVTFENLHYYVLGEVSSPGKYSIDKDQTTIIEALSEAGDLSIYALRDKVFLTRSVDDQKVTYQMDLRSHEIYQSPGFYLQQNDVIYVEPNRVRSGQSTVNGNTIKSPSFWMSLSSFIITLTLLFIN